ncbi:hypothetical protein HHI36_013424 [Cryptolaemus montrouzieri]|uniref:Uncharacterized protein n=1 Tax=Cryptolaemus montrouzieri TaxID=559131 RepID=A0ABD2NHP0_9CUCU
MNRVQRKRAFRVASAYRRVSGLAEKVVASLIGSVGGGEAKEVLRRKIGIGVAARHNVSVAETMGRIRKGHVEQKAHSGLEHVVWKGNWGAGLSPDSTIDGTWSFRGVPTSFQLQGVARVPRLWRGGHRRVQHLQL